MGTIIHNIELKPGKGGQIARSAGAGVQLMAKEGTYAHLRLNSGEMRLVRTDCRATIGQVGNLDHENVSIGKAGRSRWLGKRPKVRGVAMNPVDHPLGAAKGSHRAGGRRSPRGGSPRGGRPAGTRPRRNTSSRDGSRRSRAAFGPKGSIHSSEPAGQGRDDERFRREEAHQDLVPELDDHSGFPRAYVRRPQRQKFVPVYVTENMVGHKLGEFSPTRTFKGHGGAGGKTTAVKGR